MATKSPIRYLVRVFCSCRSRNLVMATLSQVTARNVNCGDGGVGTAHNELQEKYY